MGSRGFRLSLKVESRDFKPLIAKSFKGPGGGALATLAENFFPFEKGGKGFFHPPSELSTTL